MSNFRSCLLVLCLLALTGTGAPANADEPFAVKSLEDFLDYQYALRDAVLSGEGRFGTLAKPDKSKLLQVQDEIFRILDGKSSVRRLSDRDKKLLYNAQHVVAAIVMQSDKDMSVCRHVNEIGTHLATVQCRTTAEMRETRQDNRERFGKLQRCRGTECAGP